MSDSTPPGSWPGLGAEKESMAAGVPHDRAQDAVDAADRLSAALAEMALQLKAVNERLDSAEKAAKRSRRIIVGLVISLVLDVTLTIVVTFFAFQAHNASAQASATIAQLNATQIESCQAGNQTRAAEIQFWEHVYALADVSKAPAKQRKADNELIAYIRHVFSPRNCRALYKIRN